MDGPLSVCVPTLHFVCDEKQVVPANRILGKVRKLLGLWV